MALPCPICGQASCPCLQTIELGPAVFGAWARDCAEARGFAGPILDARSLPPTVATESYLRLLRLFAVQAARVGLLLGLQQAAPAPARAREAPAPALAAPAPAPSAPPVPASGPGFALAVAQAIEGTGGGDPSPLSFLG